jgi:hypothetical protein
MWSPRSRTMGSCEEPADIYPYAGSIATSSFKIASSTSLTPFLCLDSNSAGESGNSPEESGKREGASLEQ